jgi:hypothetical protein
MSDQEVIAQDKVNPLDINPAKVKAFAMLHKKTPVEAYAILLGRDLLELLDKSSADDEIKTIVRILITSVIGDGKL